MQHTTSKEQRNAGAVNVENRKSTRPQEEITVAAPAAAAVAHADDDER